MVVNPFWFGVGVGVFGVIVFELIALILIGISTNKKAKKGNNQ